MSLELLHCVLIKFTFPKMPTSGNLTFLFIVYTVQTTRKFNYRLTFRNLINLLASRRTLPQCQCHGQVGRLDVQPVHRRPLPGFTRDGRRLNWKQVPIGTARTHAYAPTSILAWSCPRWPWPWRKVCPSSLTIWSRKCSAIDDGL